MRLSVLTLLLLAAFPAFAQEEPIQQTINSQLEALQADDFATAFSFASPTIQGLFGTAENFGAMVQNGYPMVYRPADIQMLELREIAGNLYQRVLVTDANGRGFMLEYQMIETTEGWRIDGVDLLPQPEVGV
jgi:hypothetical protein